MIVMDTTDFMRKVIAPASSPIGSSLSGKSQEEVEASVPLGNYVSSRGRGLEQINTNLADSSELYGAVKQIRSNRFMVDINVQYFYLQ